MGNVEQDEVAGLAPGTLIDGRYKVVRFIGQGGNGLVHEVEHVLTGRRLALKSLLDESGYGRLEQEARAASLMKNPHAVKITDMGTTPSRGPYIVMELLEGQSLRALLEETGQLPLELTVNIALQVCECLAEAHSQGIVHRDLKPDNVFLVPGSSPGQYDVKVLDFGVVKIASDGPIPNSSLTRTGSTVGTPFYMSLEQLRNSSNVDARSDLYAVAVVLYESLSGSKPFQAETIGDLVYALCSGPPTHLSRLRPDLPPDLCEVVMRGLSMNREQRQASMIELAQQLLPYGDAVLGQWMNPPPKRPLSGAMPAQRAAAPAPHAPNLTPSGVKPGFGGPPPSDAPPVPVEKTTEPLPQMQPQSPPPPAGLGAFAGDRRKENIPVEVDRRLGDRRQQAVHVPEDRRAPRPPPPRVESSGDRDTPTEMYVKGVHGGVDVRGSVVTGDRDTPTSAIEPLTFTGTTTPMPPQGHPLDSADGLPTLSQPPDLGASAQAGSTLAMPPVHGGPLEPRPSFPEPRAPFPSYPGQAPGGSMASASYPAQLVAHGQNPFKPGWQVSLDRALTGIGHFVERTAQRLLLGFRSASPRQQIAIVICGASLIAILIVLTLYLIIG